MQTLEDLRTVLMPHATKFNPQSPPPHLCRWKPGNGDDRPDVVFDPEKSVVLEVWPYLIVSLYVIVYVFVLL